MFVEPLEPRRFLSITPSDPEPLASTYELTYDVARPSTPSSFRASGTSPSTVECTWKDVSGESSYELEGRKGGMSTWKRVSLPKNTTKYTVTGLESETRYEFRVRIKGSTAETTSNYSGALYATPTASECEGTAVRPADPLAGAGRRPLSQSVTSEARRPVIWIRKRRAGWRRAAR